MVNPSFRHEKIYQQNQRQFLRVLVVGAVFAVIIIISWDVILWHKIKLKNSENAIIEKKLNRINNQISELKENDNFNINQLQYLQLSTIMMLKELSIRIPQDVYLSEINQNELQIILKGGFINYENINKFIINIKKSAWLKNPTLSEVTTSNSDHSNQFILRCNL